MKKIIIYIFLLLGLVEKSNAQDEAILFKLNAKDSLGITLHWFPRNAETFWRGIKSGYIITRSDETGKKEVLNDAFFPKNKAWWAKNNIEEDSFYVAIGNIMFNSDLKDNSKKELFYNLLAYEAENDVEMAKNMGLAFEDNTAFLGKRYIYSIDFKDTKENIVKNLLYYQPYASAVTPRGVKINYDLKGAKPLRDQRYKNNVMPEMIFVQAKAYNDSIVLRFAPNDEHFWKKSIKSGFSIYRKEGNNPYDSITTIKPWKIEQFATPKALQEEKTSIVAQCIYGANTATKEDGIFGQKSELEMRFGMTMLISEQSPLAADAAGLRFVDKNVKKGAVYSYMISSAALASPFGNASVEIENKWVKNNDTTYCDAISQEHKIVLRWSKGVQYSAYRIERSDDGKNFQNMTKTPLLFIENEKTQQEPFFLYADSVGVNYKPFFYKIQGLNTFGEWATIGSTNGMAKDLTPPSMPSISYGEQLKTGIKIRWEYGATEPDFSHFKVLLSNKDDGEYKEIGSKIAAKTKEFELSNPIASNRAYYFKVAAVDTAGNMATSISKFVVVIDSIAPDAPNGFVGKIDTLGILHLSWDKNQEEDLVGYRVFVSDNPKEEFVAFHSNLLKNNELYDTVNINTLNHKMYFKLIAEDFLNNKSNFSKLLVLEKPDFIPPVTPLLLATESNQNGILLQWIPSTSDDVVKNIIFRCSQSDSTRKWTILKETDPYKTTTFLDNTAQIEQLYLYTIQSFDAAGNASERSFSVNGRRFFDGKGATVQTINASQNPTSKSIDLTWKTQQTNDDFLKKQSFYYFIYKAKGKEELAKYAQLSAEDSIFSDEEASEIGVYRYAMRVVYQDGKMSQLSKEIIYEIK